VATDLVLSATDGVSLAVRDGGGSGRPVILLHGLGDHVVSMEPLAELLRPRHRVVSMDLRGSGQSGSAAEFAWDVLVQDVEAVRTELTLGATFVVGHSLGGIVATHFGVAHPDCPGVANLDGWGFGDPDLYDGMTTEEAERTIERLRANADPLAAFAREGDEAWVAGVKALLRRSASAKGVRDIDLDEWVARSVVDLGGGRFRLRPDAVAYDAMRHDADVFGLLARIEVPTLVLTSDVAVAPSDVVAARRRGVAARLGRLEARNPHLTAHSVAGANHDSLVTTHVEHVSRLLEELIDRPTSDRPPST
jgi:pimeloyl-ACP methyl ester carboxylesterase